MPRIGDTNKPLHICLMSGLLQYPIICRYPVGIAEWKSAGVLLQSKKIHFWEKYEMQTFFILNDARGITESKLFKVAHGSTLDELTEWTIRVDKIICL